MNDRGSSDAWDDEGGRPKNPDPTAQWTNEARPAPMPIAKSASVWEHGFEGARERLKEVCENRIPLDARDREALAYLLVTSESRVDKASVDDVIAAAHRRSLDTDKLGPTTIEVLDLVEALGKAVKAMVDRDADAHTDYPLSDLPKRMHGRLERMAADLRYRAQMVSDDSDRADGEAQDDEIEALEHEAAIVERCANALVEMLREVKP